MRQLLYAITVAAVLITARSTSAQVPPPEALCGDGVCVPLVEDGCTVDCGCAARASCGEEPAGGLGCYCDTLCLDFGDCCADACEVCGACPRSCGDGYCYADGGETCATCSFDCGDCPPAPANDDFAEAITVDTLPFSIDTSTEYATLEDGEPTPCGSIGATVWYRWTPDHDATVRAETSGSDYDTVLAAYEWRRSRGHAATGLAGLTLLACNDDIDSASGDRQSEIGFSARKGQTYYLQVGGYQAAAGSLFLHVEAAVCGDGVCDLGEDAASCAADCSVANDDFADAFEAPALPFSAGASTRYATLEQGEPAPCGSIGATIWYRWTPSENLTVKADTSGSDYDTVLAAYSGTSLATLTLLACNDDGNGTSLSEIGFSAEAGETYYLQAGGYNSARGNLVLEFQAVVCGDGACDIGEDEVSCAADCLLP